MAKVLSPETEELYFSPLEVEQLKPAKRPSQPINEPSKVTISRAEEMGLDCERQSDLNATRPYLELLKNGKFCVIRERPRQRLRASKVISYHGGGGGGFEVTPYGWELIRELEEENEV